MSTIQMDPDLLDAELRILETRAMAARQYAKNLVKLIKDLDMGIHELRVQIFREKEKEAE